MKRSPLRALSATSLTAVLALSMLLAPAAPAQAAATIPIVAAGTASLESAATKAGETGRKIAMSMIALGFAIASIVLAFRRDFKEAAGIFAIGIVAILLATPAGVNVLHDTVNTLFGG
jgi:predicted secreted Zn-dependent protease